MAELPLAVEPLADERIRSALDSAGVVLFGEIHGVYENPLAVYTLMRRFELRCLGLEWPPELQLVVASFLTSGRLDFPANRPECRRPYYSGPLCSASSIESGRQVEPPCPVCPRGRLSEVERPRPRDGLLSSRRCRERAVPSLRWATCTPGYSDTGMVSRWACMSRVNIRARWRSVSNTRVALISTSPPSDSHRPSGGYRPDKNPPLTGPSPEPF